MSSQAAVRPLMACAMMVASGAMLPAPTNAAEWAPRAVATVLGSDNVSQRGSHDSGGSLAIEAGVRFAKNSGRLTGNAEFDAAHREYSESNFSGENLFRLNSDFRYTVIPDRFIWTLSDEFGQLSAFSFDPVAPSFREDTNLLRTGPTLQFSIGPRVEAQVGAHFSDVYYETADIDNQEVGGELELRRDVGALRSVYVRANAARTSFDRSELYADVENRAVLLGYRSQLRRLSLVAEVGYNSVKLGDSTASGALFRLIGYRYVAPGTLVGLDLSREYSNAAEAFRRSDTFLSSSLSDTNVLPAAEPFREERANLRLQRSVTKSELSASVYSVRESYVRSTGSDRAYWGLGARWSVKVSPNWALDASSSYERYTKAQFGLPRDARFGVGATLRLTRDISGELRIERLHREVAGLGLVPFSENRAYLSVRYAPEFIGAARGLFPNEAAPLPLQQNGTLVD